MITCGIWDGLYCFCLNNILVHFWCADKKIPYRSITEYAVSWTGNDRPKILGEDKEENESRERSSKNIRHTQWHKPEL